MPIVHQDVFVAGTSVGELAVIRSFVIEAMNKTGIDDSYSHELCLAIDEACANIMLHGTTNSQTTIKISLECHDDHCKVIIQDNASSFNPLTVPTKDMDAYFRKRDHGGLGIEIMRRIIDDIHYEKSKNMQPWNTLSFKKFFRRSRH